MSFTINSSQSIDLPLSYSYFIVKNKNVQSNFNINVILSSQLKILQGETLIEQRTYKWVRHNDILYYIFTKRNGELKDDKEPWVIEIRNKLCDLHIPSSVINLEFFDRPWLHRLFSYFLPDNYVLSHGGCIEFENTGCLILGECGKGKSTFINLAAKMGFKSLCDDRIMLKFSNDKISCYSTPWNQKNPLLITNKVCIVKGVCFLEHSIQGENSIKQLNVADNAKLIVSQFYLPIPKNQLSYLVLFNKKIIKSDIKVWEYHFLPNEGAINEFSNEFKKHFNN